VLTIVLLAFAYFEEDGILLSLTLFVIFGLVLTALSFVWRAAGISGWF
jgi:hypothetical protein